MNSRRQAEEKALRAPKSRNEIRTVDDILDDLRYLTSRFPAAAVEEAINRSQETVPFLLGFLDEVIADPGKGGGKFFGHIYALFILARLREKNALPAVLKLISLSESDLDNILGDILTENISAIIASIYDGDLEPIKNIIENPQLNIWSRDAAVHSLACLVRAEILERGIVVEYLSKLIAGSDQDMKEHGIIINVACDLYPGELYDEIRQAFSRHEVDTSIISMKCVDSVMSMGKRAALERYLYSNRHYSLIDDVFNSMGWMSAFRQEKNKTPRSELVSVQQSERMQKTGRNDPCPCGSGRKFKKCCLTIH